MANVFPAGRPGEWNVHYVRGTEIFGIEGALPGRNDLTSSLDDVVKEVIERMTADRVEKVTRVDARTFWREGRYIIDRTNGNLGVGDPRTGEMHEGNAEAFRQGRKVLVESDVSTGETKAIAVHDLATGMFAARARVQEDPTPIPTLESLDQASAQAGRRLAHEMKVDRLSGQQDIRLSAYSGAGEVVALEATQGSDRFRQRLHDLELNDGWMFLDLDVTDLEMRPMAMLPGTAPEPMATLLRAVDGRSASDLRDALRLPQSPPDSAPTGQGPGVSGLAD